MKRRWTHQASLPLDKVPQGARALEEAGVKFTNGKRPGAKSSFMVTEPLGNQSTK